MGVCAGLAERLEIDVNILRAAAFFGIIFSSIIPGLVIYTVVGLVLPPRSRVLDSYQADALDQQRKAAKEKKRAAKHEAKMAKKAEKNSRKEKHDPAIPEEENKVVYSSLKRRFADMENRTKLMEREITSSRFKLERELKSLEDL